MIRKCKSNIPSDKNFRAFQLQQRWQGNGKAKPDLNVNHTDKKKRTYVSENQKTCKLLV